MFQVLSIILNIQLRNYIVLVFNFISTEQMNVSDIENVK